jgi:hypothetical protein
MPASLTFAPAPYRHNAGVYGVADRIEFVHGDFLALAPRLKADVVFLSPPWGGPGYKACEVFDLDTMMGGMDGAHILRMALRVAGNVGYYLPKNVGLDRVGQLAAEQGVPLELEACVSADGKQKALMAYYGFDEAGEEEGAGEGREGEREGERRDAPSPRMQRWRLCSKPRQDECTHGSDMSHVDDIVAVHREVSRRG